MATITYNFIPNQTVWVISSRGVKKGTVLQVNAHVTLLMSSLAYDVDVEDTPGTESFFEVDVFSSILNAVNEYETRITP